MKCVSCGYARAYLGPFCDRCNREDFRRTLQRIDQVVATRFGSDRWAWHSDYLRRSEERARQRELERDVAEYNQRLVIRAVLREDATESAAPQAIAAPKARNEGRRMTPEELHDLGAVYVNLGFLLPDGTTIVPLIVQSCGPNEGQEPQGTNHQ